MPGSAFDEEAEPQQAQEQVGGGTTAGPTSSSAWAPARSGAPASPPGWASTSPA